VSSTREERYDGRYTRNCPEANIRTEILADEKRFTTAAAIDAFTPTIIFTSV
jgi:hypothetical protein